MPDLYLQPNEPITKAVASELKLASDVPSDCKVYIFYIPGIVNYPELQSTLNDWGKIAGKNAFVGLLTSDAPDFETIAGYFKVEKSPAVVISALPSFASVIENREIITGYFETDATTGFVRIDNPRVLGNKAEVTECINEMYNLFIQKKVREAISIAKKDGFKKSLKYYLGRLKEEIAQFLNNHNVTVDVFKGTIAISPSEKKPPAK